MGLYSTRTVTQPNNRPRGKGLYATRPVTTTTDPVETDSGRLPGSTTMPQRGQSSGGSSHPWTRATRRGNRGSAASGARVPPVDRSVPRTRPTAAPPGAPRPARPCRSAFPGGVLVAVPLFLGTSRGTPLPTPRPLYPQMYLDALLEVYHSYGQVAAPLDSSDPGTLQWLWYLPAHICIHI